LNERQQRAVTYVREHGKITNREYRQLTNISDEAARKDLAEMRERGILQVFGKGRNTTYALAKWRSDGD
jgi:ATP-dependent DNA helicase RecG